MKFVHLILGKIFKFVATGCEILRLKCTEFNFAGALPQTPLESLQLDLKGLLLSELSEGGETV